MPCQPAQLLSLAVLYFVESQAICIGGRLQQLEQLVYKGQPVLKGQPALTVVSNGSWAGINKVNYFGTVVFDIE